LNILFDKWFPVIRHDKSEDTISFLDITDQNDNNPIVDILTPRPDLKNAIYQLFIGLLQVAMTPENNVAWAKFWESTPDKKLLNEKFSNLIPFFEIDSDGPAFMQDYDLKDGEEKPVASLFIESPGAKTIKDNLDHFIKRETITALNPYWAALALYTLQTFAPAGGVGHRVGVRGGGPLTTLVIPHDLEKPTTLWKKLWVNVLPKNDVINNSRCGDYEKNNPEAIFPWLKPTKTSENKESELYPQECHPFHVFFAMPRRIRLRFSNEPGICSLTGKQCSKVVRSFVTQNYGNNYSGLWIHPLNAYRYDPNHLDAPPLSIKGQPGGVHYRHWLCLTIGDNSIKPAAVVKCIEQDAVKRIMLEKQRPLLWAAGYDMDNMKARSWHESTMPYYAMSNEQALLLAKYVTILIEAAKEIAGNLRSAIKHAWFKDTTTPAAKHADFSFLDNAFWQNTEMQFYEQVDILRAEILNNNLSDQVVRAKVAKSWLWTLRSFCMQSFDLWCLSSSDGKKDLRQVFKARIDLEKWIKFGKKAKELDSWDENNSGQKENDKPEKIKAKKNRLPKKGKE
jgi:CRISPR system Cascade subunit CasA